VSILFKTFCTYSVSKAGVLPSVRENFYVLTSRAGFMAKMPFSVSQEKSTRIGHFGVTKRRTSYTSFEGSENPPFD
jgi:hypothetical protein